MRIAMTRVLLAALVCLIADSRARAQSGGSFVGDILVSTDLSNGGTAGAQMGQILAYKTDGTYAGVFATLPNTPYATSTIAYPVGLAMGADGNVYVADKNNYDVLEYNGATGALISTFVTPNSSAYQLYGISFGPNGNLFGADILNNSIDEFNGKTGAYMGQFVASGANGLNSPGDVLFSHNVMYVSNGDNTVLAYNATTGAYETKYTLPGGVGSVSYPYYMVADKSGNIYIAGGNTEVYKLDISSGNVSVFATAPLSNTSDGLLFAPNGNLLMSDGNTYSNNIYAFDGTTGALLGNFASVNTSGVSGYPDSMILDAAAVPEPGSMLLLAMGGFGIVLARRLHRRRSAD